jgi:LytS/YehU family sensor histidine kinase
MTILLAEFLRRSLRLGSREEIPLAEELAHAAGYLAVERARFGDRLRIEEEIEEACLRCRVPSLILQPLVENAVRHGIAQLLEGGAIRIEARRVDGFLCLAVENPCDPDHRPPRGEGVGLANVTARLRALYGRQAESKTVPQAGRFRVELKLPAREIEIREEDRV